MRTLIVFLAGCLFTITASAQADSTNQEKSTSFSIGVFYNSNLNYYGRTDSLRSSGVFPLAEFSFAKGLYINAAPVFINNSTTSLDYAGTVATAGYRFNSHNKWGGNIYFVKPFYEANSQLVQSALKGQFTANFTWMNRILNVTGGGDLKFSDNTDYGATAGVDHLVRLTPGNGWVFVMDPSAYVYASTQRFSQTYYKKTPGFLFFPGTEQAVTEESRRFSVISYEFSMPLVLAKGKWQLIANPAYVLPQNLVAVEGRPDLSERGKDLFYITVGTRVTL